MYNTKKPVGNGINAPVKGTSEASKSMNVSLKSASNINISASTQNLSAKFKNPNKKQDVPAEAKNQYTA
jgi:hypothetical protein